jgi:ubiquinol oxidase
MQLIEDHAYKTYSAYVKCNAAWLKTQPAPAIAKQYYESEDLYLFDSFHTAIPETAGACLCACA